MFTAAVLALCGSPVLAQAQGTTPNVLRVATASTAGETGIIGALAREFEARNPGVKLELEFSGAIAVLDRARAGGADLIITHHPESEAVFVDEGYGLLNTVIMYNEFALFGPARDPLRLHEETDIREILRRLAENQVAFLVPGRRSGTYKKLSELWIMAAIEPSWPGYEITGESSAGTLRSAALFGAYSFADLGTYLANRTELSGKLVPLVRDHVALRNYYSAIVVSAQKVAGVNQALAERFLAYLVSDVGQENIRRFGEERLGAQIFTPAAYLDEGLRARRIAAELAAQSQNLRRVVALAMVLALAGIVAMLLFVRVRRLESKARRSEERYALAIAGANDGIWDWDLVADRMYLSERLREILGMRSDERFVEAPRTVFAAGIHPEDRERVMSLLEQHLAQAGDAPFEAECRWGADTQSFRWVLIRGKLRRSAAGKPTRMSGSLTDVSPRKAQEEALLFQALHDTLTELPNRKLLLDRTDQALRLAKRAKHSLALIVLGVDRFKEINDTLGYGVGDQILKEVAARLARSLRASDTVARLGGDEFAVLLPDVAGEMYASHVAKKISVALCRPLDLEQHALHIAATVGFAIYPQHGESAEDLVRHADVAMHTAKRAGNACAIYDPEQDKGGARRLSLANDLHEALDRDGLSVHFQPKIDLGGGTAIGVEALLRWDHPRQGRIPPDEIIPIAEQTGLIKPLTLWILDASLQQQVEWLRRGIMLKVAVNISMWSLQDPRFSREVADALERWKVPGSHLELEITESAMMSDPARSLDILTQLAGMGIGLSVDDYGTGFSSLAYLKRLPVNTIKIDKSFVMNMDLDDGNAVIVRSTIELAHNLGLTVVAEGVENRIISERLAEFGCDTAQGYYYCRPTDAESCTRWLAESPWGVAASKKVSVH
jgi:diguanylate cyclase (GGDEF)-like protein/PAS domain S-box-containing protein